MGMGRPTATEQIGSLSGNLVTQTDADLTLYVRTTGNDSNDGLTTGNALLTIQEAIDRIPKFINHTVVVDVGEGNFGGAIAMGFIEGSTSSGLGSLTVKGTLGQPTVDGNETGTATGGTTIQLVDSGGGWTANQLRGYLLKVGSEYRVIYQNTGTTIDVVRAFGSSVSGKAYEILEQKTVINSAEPVTTWGGFTVRYCETQIQIQDINFTAGIIGILSSYSMAPAEPTRCKFSSNSYAGYFCQDAFQEFVMNDCAAMSCQIGYFLTQGSMLREACGCLAYNSTTWGFDIAFSGIGYILLKEIVSIDNGSSGILFDGCAAHVDIEDAIISGNGLYGIDVYEMDHISIEGIGNITMNNNTSDAFYISGPSNVRLTACTGTGNGGYGLRLEKGATACISSATSVTGSSGDATINDGTTVLDWSDHFGSNGDIAVNVDTGCRIERRD